MEWLNELLGVGVSAASGGVFGLLASVVGVFAKSKQEKQRQSWEEKKWEYEVKLLEMQAKAANEETERELAVSSQEGSYNGLQMSINSDTAISNTHKWVQDVRALFRPFLTVGLWASTIYIFTRITNMPVESLNPAEADELISYMVVSVVFSCTTATAWWFGDRALTPPSMKNQ
jgi:hypothetical protein